MAIYSLFTLSSGLIKMSVLLFYRRLSSRAVSPTFRSLLQITWITVCIYTIAFVLIPLFACRPITAFWDQVDVKKTAAAAGGGGYQYTCINEGAGIVASGVASTIQDFVVAFLPTLLCWNLHLPVRQKVALYGVFGVGYLTVGIGAMRTYTGYRIFFQTYDVTWVASDTWLCSLLELHIGSMCANAPALKVFFLQFFNEERMSKWTQSWSRSRSAGKRENDTNTTFPSTVSRLTVREKMAFWKKSLYSRDTSGSVSKSYTHGSTERGGWGEALQMDAHYSSHNLQRDSMSKPLAPEYADTVIQHNRHYIYHDIELGNLSPHRSLDGSEVLALPPISPPEPARCRSGSPFSRRLGVFQNTRMGQYVWKPWDREVKEMTCLSGNGNV